MAIEKGPLDGVHLYPYVYVSVKREDAHVTVLIEYETKTLSVSMGASEAKRLFETGIDFCDEILTAPKPSENVRRVHGLFQSFCK